MMLTASQVAAILSVDSSTVRAWAKSKRIKAVLISESAKYVTIRIELQTVEKILGRPLNQEEWKLLGIGAENQ